MLLVGIIIGALGGAFYSGIRSGEPDRLGSGLKQWLAVPRNDAELTPLLVPDAAPERTTFDFFTVLPEIERVITESAAQEKVAVESGKVASETRVVVPDSPNGYYMLQAASYSQQVEADLMKARLADAGFLPSIQHISIQGQGDFYRVRIGPFFTMPQLEAANRELAGIGIQTLRLKVSRP